VRFPVKGDAMLLSVGGDKRKAVEIARRLSSMELKIYATEHTAEALRSNGVHCETLYKISEGKEPNVLDYLEKGKIKLVINTPSPGNISTQAVSDGFLIRRRTVEFGIPIITNLELADTFADALEHF
jgi:carbamoyl-phosphate synthase large subunit